MDVCTTNAHGFLLFPSESMASFQTRWRLLLIYSKYWGEGPKEGGFWGEACGLESGV